MKTEDDVESLSRQRLLSVPEYRMSFHRHLCWTTYRRSTAWERRTDIRTECFTEAPLLLELADGLGKRENGMGVNIHGIVGTKHSCLPFQTQT